MQRYNEMTVQNGSGRTDATNGTEKLPKMYDIVLRGESAIETCCLLCR